jgi:hypothetical protein
MLGLMIFRTKIWINRFQNRFFQNRFFLFVVSKLPVRWVKWLGLLKTPMQPMKPKNPVLEYINKNRIKLDKSFQREEEQLGLIIADDNPGGFFSSNIEYEIYSKKHLKEILSDPNNHLEKAWKKRILIETTPRGNIYMYYDIFKHGFAYYSDQTGIPYTILNAVAMKYVMVFFCRDFYLDEATVPIGKMSPLMNVFFYDDEEEMKKIKKEKREKNGIPEIDIKKGPFVKLKDYSKNSCDVSSDTHSKIDVQTKKTIASIIYEIYEKIMNNIIGLKSKSNTEPVILCDIPDNIEKKPRKELMTNKFIYLGHLHNWQPLQKISITTKKVNSITKFDNMFSENHDLSYRDWINIKSKA